jgi:hypothetical protein
MSEPLPEERAAQYAAALGQLQELAAPAFAQLAFEEEPAGYVAAQREGAP